MNDSKLSTKECIALTLVSLISNSILSLVTNLIATTMSSIFINLIFIGVITFLICLLVVHLFKRFPRI